MRAALSTTREISGSSAIGSGWTSYLTPDGKLVPVFNCNPPEDIGQTCEPQGTRWKDGKLYLTTRHRGILTYDPKTKELKTLVYTWRNQLFKGPNDLDFDAEGNLFFTDPWATGPGPNMSDQQRRGVPVFEGRHPAEGDGRPEFPERDRGVAGQQHVGGRRLHGSRMIYGTFATGPTLGTPGAKPDPLHLTFQSVRAGTYFPGTGCPDGLHYDVKGNLWVAVAGLGGIMQVDPRGLIVGFVPIPAPGGDLATTNFAFGGQDNKTSLSWRPTAARSGASRRPFPG